VHSKTDAMQYVRDNVPEKRIFFLDDDASFFFKPYQETLVKITGEEAICNIFNLTVMAIDLGVPLYGFASLGSVTHYRVDTPFSFTRFFPDACMGFNDTNLRSEFQLNEDVDLIMQALRDNRIVLCSNLMCARYKCDSNIGGNTGIKSLKVVEYWRNRIKEKWGNYVQFIDKGKHGNNFKIKIHVQRKQDIKVDD
jgi:hypothetical protein